MAELTRLRARSLVPGRRAPIAAEAQLLAEQLRGHGLANGAALADLAARARLAAGIQASLIEARAGPSGGAGEDRPLRVGPGRVAEREGRTGTALAELRAGLATVQARRGQLGSVDLGPAPAPSARSWLTLACGWP